MTLFTHDGYGGYTTTAVASTTSNVHTSAGLSYTSTSLLFPDKPQVRADCRTCGAPSQPVGSACRFCTHAVGE